MIFILEFKGYQGKIDFLKVLMALMDRLAFQYTLNCTADEKFSINASP